MIEVGIFEMKKRGLWLVTVWYQSGRSKDFYGATRIDAINQLPQAVYKPLVTGKLKQYKTIEREAVTGTYYK